MKAIDGRYPAIFSTGFFLIIFLFTTMVQPLEPPTREQLERYRADGSMARRIEAAIAIGNHRVSPQLIRRFTYRMQQQYLEMQGKTKGEIQQLLSAVPPEPPMPLTGTVKIFILPIAFSDYPGHNSISSLNNTIFGEGNPDYYPFDGLRTFYMRSSYGQLELTGTVLDLYTTPYPRGQVPENTNGQNNLIIEALAYHDARGHDFSQYDNNGDGMVDYFAVIWTGPRGEWASFWWGYKTWFNADFELDGKSFGMFSWQPEGYVQPDSFHPYTLIHETGHALGLPDYYDYDPSIGPGGGIGNIDVMDGYRGDHNCFSKYLLGWITPFIYDSGSHTPVLRESSAHPDAVVFMPNVTDIYSEFFMVQNRSRLGNDTGLPNDGLLVWHVDAHLGNFGHFMYNNSFSDHKLLQLMQADGMNEIEIFGKPADADDYYTAGNILGPGTRPNSNAYDGMKTYCELSGISETGPTMSCDISVGIYPPMDFTAVRHENRSLFFLEYIIDFSWNPNPANYDFPIEQYSIYHVTNEARTKIADIPVNTNSYRLRPVYERNQTYTMAAVTDDGLESPEVSVTVE